MVLSWSNSWGCIWGEHPGAGASGSPRGPVPTCGDALGKATAASNGKVAQCDSRPQGSLGHGSTPSVGTLHAAAPSNPVCCSPAVGLLLCPGGTARLLAVVTKSARKLGLHLQHGGGGGRSRPRWAVGWRQKGSRGNHQCGKAVRRQEVMRTSCGGADEPSSPEGPSRASLAPKLRFRGMPRQSGGSRGLGRQTGAWKSSTSCFGAAGSGQDPAGPQGLGLRQRLHGQSWWFWSLCPISNQQKFRSHHTAPLGWGL